MILTQRHERDALEGLQEGLKSASDSLSYVSLAVKENVVPFSGEVKKIVDEFVKNGAQVIIANSFSQRDEILQLANTYLKVTFLTCASYTTNKKNAISFTAHSEQAWFVAGKVAAAKTTQKPRGTLPAPAPPRRRSARRARSPFARSGGLVDQLTLGCAPLTAQLGSATPVIVGK